MIALLLMMVPLGAVDYEMKARELAEIIISNSDQEKPFVSDERILVDGEVFAVVYKAIAAKIPERERGMTQEKKDSELKHILQSTVSSYDISMKILAEKMKIDGNPLSGLTYEGMTHHVDPTLSTDEVDAKVDMKLIFSKPATNGSGSVIVIPMRLWRLGERLYLTGVGRFSLVP